MNKKQRELKKAKEEAGKLATEMYLLSDKLRKWGINPFYCSPELMYSKEEIITQLGHSENVAKKIARYAKRVWEIISYEAPNKFKEIEMLEEE